MSFIASVTDENIDLSSFVPVIKVIGVGGAGGNAIANIMGLEGVECAIANTDAQSLVLSPCKNRIQLGRTLTAGLGAGALPEVGKKAALESKDEIVSFLTGTNMVFITAGMGGGTGTGAAPVIAQIAREMGILTVAVVTKPFNFEGYHRIELAELGVQELAKHVDTIIVVANQKLFRVSNENTTFTEAFRMADEVLYSGVKCITDLITMPGLINLDFADIRTIMSNMGYAMMGSSESSGENRATNAIEMAITNPLLENVSLEGAKGILVNITGGPDMTLFEVNDVVAKIQEKIDRNTRLIFGAIFDQNMEGRLSVSVVATGVHSNDKKDINIAAVKNQHKEEVPEENSRTYNKPPYMQNATPQQNTSVYNKRSEKQAFQESKQESFAPVKSVDDEFENESFGFETKTVHFDAPYDSKFDVDIENDLINAVGGEDFLAPEANHQSPKKSLLHNNNNHFAADTREIRNNFSNQHNIQQQDRSSFSSQQTRPQQQSYEQHHIKPEQDKKGEFLGEISDNVITDEARQAKASIFSRMADIIKNKHDNYKESTQKKSEGKDGDLYMMNNTNASSNKHQDTKNKINNGGFFSVIENE